MRNRIKSRGKNISDSDIEIIVGIFDGWSGRLTWDTLIGAIEERIFVKYTRQALHKHERIRLAYENYKNKKINVKLEDPVKLSDFETCALLDRLKKIENENLRLKNENSRLLEQFVVWAYNAHIKGLDVQYLNRPLPNVNRDVTRNEI